MKLSTIFLSALLMVTQFVSSEGSHGFYCAELEAFKNKAENKIIFDEKSYLGFTLLQRDMINFKALTPWQRIMHVIILEFDGIVVTPDSMPLLHGYVDTLCKQQDIVTPRIFITRTKGFFNAIATKLCLGMEENIFIGQHMIQDCSDEELEAVIAHELGHIKHKHLHKKIAVIYGGTTFFCASVAYALWPKIVECGTNRTLADVLKLVVGLEVTLATGLALSTLASKCAFKKELEKEADLFACKDAGKAAGLIKFFEHAQQLGQSQEERMNKEFGETLALLEQQKETLKDDYTALLGRFVIMQWHYSFVKWYRNFSYNTLWGEHPSPEARIAAAKEYLAQQENMQHA